MTDDIRAAVKKIKQKVQRAIAARQLEDGPRLALELDLALIACRELLTLVPSDGEPKE